DYAKSFYNDVKRKQKDLGNAIEVEDKIKDIDGEIKDKSKELDSLREEKNLFEIKQNDLNNDILELTKSIDKIEAHGLTKDVELVETDIQNRKNAIVLHEKSILETNEWLSNNHKKELPYEKGEDISVLNKRLIDEKNSLTQLTKDTSDKK